MISSPRRSRRRSTSSTNARVAGETGASRRAMSANVSHIGSVERRGVQRPRPAHPPEHRAGDDRVADAARARAGSPPPCPPPRSRRGASRRRAGPARRAGGGSGRPSRSRRRRGRAAARRAARSSSGSAIAVGVAAHDDELLAMDGPELEPVVVDGKDDEGCLEPSLADRVGDEGGVLADQPEPDVRVAPAEVADEIGDEDTPTPCRTCRSSASRREARARRGRRRARGRRPRGRAPPRGETPDRPR